MNFDEHLHQILNSCDKDQLNKYLNDEEQTDLLVKSMEYYQQLLKDKENLQNRNKLIAESNLRLEPVLNNVKTQLKQAISEFEEAKTEYLLLKETHDAQSLANEEEESDNQADKFFCSYNVQHNDEELNNFQRQFLEERTQVHLKKIKADKLKELLPQ
ncbi:unnamed protein product [Brachionus calyciflorus]|uniref:VPS37 C-terminal domain-containing protein n=1 Tax=Brachionus calyciflorus TaxID=104777 RepID=A0A814GMU3_9BILA|nr:unnamed protein product [Brachionus calyciflorus]